MAQYYIKVSGRSFGPLSSERVRSMIEAGKIQSNTELSLNRLDWKAVSEIGEFAGAFATGGGEDPVAESGAASSGSHDQPAAPRNPTSLESKEWFYSVDGKTGYGPYRISELLSFLDQNKINFDSLVWRDGEGSRPLRKEPILMVAYEKAHFAVSPEPQDAATSAAAPSKTPSDPNELDGFGLGLPYAMGKIRSALDFWHTASLVFFILGLAATTAFAFAAGSGVLKTENGLGNFEGLGAWLFVASLLIIGLGGLLQYFFVYYLWKAIPPRFRRMSPLIASLCLLIPLFKFYWLFVAFGRGADCLDRSLNQFAQNGLSRGEKPIYAYSAPSVIFCIITILSAICYNFVASYFPIVLFFSAFQPLVFWILMKPMKRSAFLLLSWRSLEPRKTKTTINDLAV